MASVKPVADNHKFNEASLVSYLQVNLRGFKEAHALSPLTVRQFTHGQSNPTFYLEVGTKETSRKYVLRKKPPGKLLPSAHAVEREYRIMKALAATSVPVPRVHLLCTDSSVIGTPFYVMDYVEGRIFKDVTLPGQSWGQRFAIYSAMNRTLAALHRVDYKSIGLGDFGKTENYVQRQAERWASQYEASKTDGIPAMDQLKAYLLDHCPRDEDSKSITIVHGDYRLDNIIFHPTEPRILAILDWELSTLGHPISDLVYNCMPYYSPSPQKDLKEADFRALGVPTLDEYVSAYVRDSHRFGPITNFEYYQALSFFRMAAIAQGVYKRFLQGNSSSSQAEMYGGVAKLFASLGLEASEGKLEPKPKRNNKHWYAVQSASSRLLPGKFSEKFWEIRAKLLDFMDEYIYPNESTYLHQHHREAKEKGTIWVIPPIMEQLKIKAKEQGLWNLFLTKNKTHSHGLGPGLTNLEYAPLCEIMGRSFFLAPEVFNCAAPDTGNMETIAMYGTEEQKKEWLEPLLRGEIRSCFGMTEPRVASSDATNIETLIEDRGDKYVINGHKWWTSGAMDPRCKVCILMGKTKTDSKTPIHQQQSMILVPMDLPGVKIIRPLEVFGSPDAPHGHAEMQFTDVEVPKKNILLGPGRGFEISQGRLGPGRIHHCMRLIGMAERALEIQIRRVHNRIAFKTSIAQKGAMLADISESRIEIEQCRLLTLQAAAMIDEVGAKNARQQIAMIKVANPSMALRVIDRAIQAHGGMGVCQDTVLPFFWMQARTLRIADGPDEVHRETIAKMELTRAKL